MKRRQYLAGVGGVLGGASLLGMGAKSSCKPNHEWVGQIVDEPVDFTGELTVSLDGYTKETVKWVASRGQYFCKISATEQSCASVTNYTISIPEPDMYCTRIVVMLEPENSKKLIIAQYLLDGDSWVPIITDDTD